jgi:tRNA(Arg) A34 adenosine deaminase TadA
VDASEEPAMPQTDRRLLEEAFALAQRSYSEAGLPIGSVLVETVR